MPWYVATRHITHNDVAYPIGAVAEFPASEVKSDGFVLCDPPEGKAPKAEKVEAAVDSKPADAPKSKAEARAHK